MPFKLFEMKAQFFRFLLLVFSIQIFALLSLTAQTLPFTKGNLAQVKSKSLTEGKLHFAYFYTDWCLPCKWMEDNTFKDPELIQFVQQNYLPVKLNIDDRDGQQMREQFDVEFLPTLIIFNQSGDIVEKFEESLTASRLLDALKKQRLNMAGASVKLPPLKKSTPSSAEKQQEAPKEEKVITLREETTTTATKPAMEVKKEADPSPSKPIEQPRVESPPKQPVTPVSPEQILPEKTKMDQPVEEALVAKSTQTPPTSTETTKDRPSSSSDALYAVQVGTYTRFENADARRKELKLIYGEGVHIKIDNSAKETIYRVMVGRFNQPNDARELVDLLKKQNIEGFVKEITID